MKDLNYSKILIKNWDIVALIMAVAVVLVLIITIIQPFQYSASTQVLIIQKKQNTTDAYTATKSAERIGKNLANIIYTTSFYNQILAGNQELATMFPQDSLKLKKAWEKNVKVNVIPETGILQIKAYDTDRKQAAELVKNIAFSLVTRGQEYHGRGSDVEIKIVDDVFTSRFPVRPNILINLGLAVILGIIFGCAYVVFISARKADKALTQIENQVIKQPEKLTEQEPNLDKKVEKKTKNSKKTKISRPQEPLTKQPQIITMHDHLKQVS